MDPKKLKVQELREELNRRGIDSNGVKQDLIQRLQVALDEEEFGISAETALLSAHVPEAKSVDFEAHTEEVDADNDDAGDENAQEVDASQPPATETSPTTTTTAGEDTSNSVEEKKVATPTSKSNGTNSTSSASTSATSSSSSATTTTATTTSTVSSASQKQPKNPVASTTPSASSNNAGKPITEAEKRANRAAKFNLPKNESEVIKEKLAARAERFGLQQQQQQQDAGPTLEEKKRARAERFGSTEKTKVPDSTTTDAVKAARAMRFQMGATGNTKTVMTDMQEKKKRRLDRFGGTDA